MVGFGLAQIKPQGKTFSPRFPAIPPWHGCGNEFENYFQKRYGDKYAAPYRSFVKKIAQHAWDHALLENQKKTYGDR